MKLLSVAGSPVLPVRGRCCWCLHEKAGKLQTVCSSGAAGTHQHGTADLGPGITILSSSGVGCHARCHTVMLSWPCGHCLLSADTALDTR